MCSGEGEKDELDEMKMPVDDFRKEGRNPLMNNTNISSIYDSPDPLLN